VSSRFSVEDLDDVRRTAIVGLGALLGTAPLWVVFTDWHWFIEGAGAILCVLLPAMYLRIRSVPRLYQLLPGLVVLVVYATMLYLHRDAIGGLLPGPGAWHEFHHLQSVGSEQVRDGVAPIASTHALRLDVVPALGLFAALVDALAVVRRSPALAGIALLILFTTCAAVAGSSVSWIPFSTAAIGFLLILSADARSSLLRWGRVVSRREGDHSNRPNLALSGRRIAIIAVGIAIVIPSVLPGLTRNDLVDSLHRGQGGGVGSQGTGLSPLARLKGSKTIPLAVVTVPAGAKPFYLRSKVLDTYGKSGWSFTGVFADQPISAVRFAAPNSAAVKYVKYRAKITISNLKDDATPTFGEPGGLFNLNDHWEFDPSLGTVQGSTTELDQAYTEDVVAAAPTTTQVDAASAATAAARWTRLPSNLPSPVKQLVAKVTAGKRTAGEKALALEQYFLNPNNGFVYSLSTKSGDSGDDLVDFLNNRAGFCQQYASALAVMLRVAHIPSRVVLGYTHDSADSAGTFTVTNHDAHAWVEADLNGLGWLPLDPTPLGSAGGDNAARQVALPYGGSVAATSSPTVSAGNDTRPRVNGSIPQASGPTLAAGPGSVGSGSGLSIPTWLLVTLAIVVTVALALALAPALRLARRRRRWREALNSRTVEPLWEEFYASAVDSGVGWTDATTPRQVPDWLASRGLSATSTLSGLAQAVEHERYAESDGTGGASTQQIGDLIDRVRRSSVAMKAPLRRRARIRALLLPASLIRHRNRD
jgi:hypothetical protein